jgi:acetyl-CoA acetyltransferase family protein
MREVVIVDAVRSPVGRVGGALAAVRPDDLLSYVLKGLIERTGIDPALVEDVYAGCGNQAGEDNRDVARMASLLAGFPKEVGGLTVNRNCASGLEAVNIAAKSILVGEGDVFVGGGGESMSRAPWTMPKPARGYQVGQPKIYDTTVGWRYENPRMDAMYPIISLGATAENIAEEMDITREDQDAFSVESHRRAVAAINEGKFKDEIIPVSVPQRKKDPLLVDTDEHPRYRKENGHYELATSMEQLARLRPAFRKGGTVTAGKRLNLTMDDIALIELNEAFAAQSLGVMRQLGLDPEITNVNGGAVALGHPLGCSGARILTTLLHEMKRRAPSESRPYYGLASLCVGVGQGVSTIVEWLD